MRDNQDLLVERLGRLVEVLESQEFGDTTVNRDVTIRTDEPTDENTPTYFSTGTDRLGVESTNEWRRLDFGFSAKTINIRTTDDIEVSFAKPTSGGTNMTIRSSESPFTIGGDPGINTAFMWIRQADSAQNTPGIEILAYR